MNWVFAIVNGRLTEFFFEKKRGKVYALGHAYVKLSEYKTLREQRIIKSDTKKYRFTHRKKQYKNQLTGKMEAQGSFER